MLALARWRAKGCVADAYVKVSAAWLGKRHKQAQDAVPAAVHDPTRARVEGILAASAACGACGRPGHGDD